MEDRVAPSLHVDGPARVIVPCALSGVMKSYRTVQISSTLQTNANNIYSITTYCCSPPQRD